MEPRQRTDQLESRRPDLALKGLYLFIFIYLTSAKAVEEAAQLDAILDTEADRKSVV